MTPLMGRCCAFLSMPSSLPPMTQTGPLHFQTFRPNPTYWNQQPRTTLRAQWSGHGGDVTTHEGVRVGQRRWIDVASAYASDSALVDGAHASSALSDRFTSSSEERNDDDDRDPNPLLLSFEERFADASVYENGDGGGGRRHLGSAATPLIRPSYLRLRPGSPAAPLEEVLTKHSDDSDLLITDEGVRSADRAVESTMRWCQDFVADIGLCPWANLSLSTAGAIRVKVVPQEMGVEAFEGVVRSAAEELVRVTGGANADSGPPPPISFMDSATGGAGTDAVSVVVGGKNDEPRREEAACPRGSAVNPNAAITFIVAVPPEKLSQDGGSRRQIGDFRFDQFVQFVFDLEEGLFEDDHGDNDEDFPHIFDLVTVAPFHPQWRFASASGEEDDGDDNGDCLDWEKRSPFPTVSVVLTSAIIAAGEESTRRIGLYNQQVLEKFGSRALSDIFRERVLLQGGGEAE